MYLIFRSFIDIFDEFFIRIIMRMVSLLPGRPGNSIIAPLRICLLRILGLKITSDSQISPGFNIYKRGNFKAGNKCRFGYDFKVWNFESLIIGERLLASHGIKIICANHLLTKDREDLPGPVSVGDDVWIGANVTIVGPCNIGDGVIIGANSFVTGNLKAGWIYAGSPAKPIRLVQQEGSEFEECQN